MGYTFARDDLEVICRRPGMERQGKTAVWKGIGPDRKKRTCIIHAKHKGNVGSGLAQRIAARELLFASAEEMYRFLNVK